MTIVINKLNAFSPSWVVSMWAVIWQSTLLAVAVAAVLLAWRSLSPWWRCWVWRIVAVKLLLMPFWIVTIPVSQHHLSIVPTSMAAIIPNPTTQATFDDVDVPAAPNHETRLTSTASIIAAATAELSARPTWQTWLVAAWLAVIVIQFVRLVWQRIQLRRLLAAARPADENVFRIVANGCGQLRLACVPETRITAFDVSPFVARITRPVLVLPESMAGPYDASQLRQIVLHELAHVRRADLLWCWITYLVRLVYWFHPVAHWVAFRESLERELACDELAMTHSGATAANYARTLIEAASRLAQPAVFRAAVATHLDGGIAIGSSRQTTTGGGSTATGGIQ
jgi:bla regulator protein blaR1